MYRNGVSQFLLITILFFATSFAHKAEANCDILALTNSTSSLNKFNNCFNVPQPPATPISAPTASSNEFQVNQSFDVVIPPQIYDITQPIPTYFQLYESRNNASFSSLGNISTLGDTKKTRTLTSTGPVYYKYRACNSDGCSSYSPTLTLTIINAPTGENYAQKGGSIPDAPVTPPSVPASNFYGPTPGAASTNGGAALYSVDVVVPPGRADMQPNVSISYSSRSGYGTAGVGWSVSAAGSISRCPATLAQDGRMGSVTFGTTNDKLCLNGQRLIAISGSYGNVNTKYALEMDNNTRVFQRGGNLDSTGTYFEVYSPNLNLSYYGSTSNSKMSPDGTSKTQAWLLNKTLDAGRVNHISYYYEDFGFGELLIDRIAYTGNGSTDGNRTVHFEYENRNQVRFSYLAGTKTRTSKRLDYVETRYNNLRVRRYSLNYQVSDSSGRDLMHSIRECGYDNGTQCRDYTTFNYSEESPSIDFQPLSTTGSLAYPNATDIHEIMPRGDLNGDGARDWPGVFVNAEGDQTGTTTQELYPCYRNYLMASPVCVNLDFNLDGITDDWDDVNNTLRLKNSVTNSWINTGISLSKRGGALAFKDSHIAHIGDYNRDGWPDLVMYQFNNQAPKYYLHLHTKNANSPYSSNGQLLYSVPTTYTGSSTSLQPTHDLQFMGDMNGDALPDMVLASTVAGRYEAPYAQPRPIAIWYYKGSSNSFDKRTFTYNNGNYGESADFSYFIDINSDGLTDWLGLQPINGTSGQLVARINKGNKTFSSQKTVGGDSFRQKLSLVNISNDPAEPDLVNVLTFFYSSAFKVADIDGDGLIEILEPATRIIEACTRVDSVTGTSTRCGDSLYGVFQEENGVVIPLKSSEVDDSIYTWSAFHFNIDANENISLSKQPTGYIGHAYESEMTDVYGTGLPSMVSLHRKSGDTTFNGNGAGTDFAPYFGDYGAYVSLNRGAARGNEHYKPHDLLESVDNPNGISANWVYRPLTTGEYGRSFRTGESTDYPGETNRPFYYPDFDYTGQLSDTNNDYFHFASSMYAVAEFRVDNGVGGQNAQKFRYTAAVYNTKGRGFMGFREIEQDSISTGITTDIVFHEMFPFTGRVESVEKRLNQGRLPFETTNNNWSINPAHQSSVPGTIMLFNQSRTIVSNDAYNTDVNIYTQTSSVDSANIDRYGNVLRGVTQRSDIYGIYTTTDTADFRAANELWPHRLYSQTTSKVYQRSSLVPYVSGVDINKVSTTYIESYHSLHRKPLKVTVSGTNGIRSSATCNSSSTNQCSTLTNVYNSFGLPTSTTTQGAGLTGTSNSSSLQTRTTNFNYSNTGTSVAVDGYFVYQSTRVVGGFTHRTTTKTDPRLGETVSFTSVNGNVRTTEFDSFSRPVQINEPGMQPRYVRYNLPDSLAPSHSEMMTTTIQAGAPDSRIYSDEFGRSLRTATKGFDGDWIFTDVLYDERGNVTHESMPYESLPVFTQYLNYDAFGRMGKKLSAAVDASDDLTTDYSYVGLETIVNTFAPQGEELTMSYYHNSLGLQMRTVDNLNGNVTYSYDASHNIIGVTDSANILTKANYDELGRKIWVDDPNQGRTSFLHNDFGELERVNDANGEYLIYEYDSLGRITSRLSSDGDSVFVWDTRVIGMKTSESTSGISRNYVYDSLARPTTVTTLIDGTSYVVTTLIDGNYGRVKGLKYPNDLTVKMSYNQQGYLMSESNAASGFVYRHITEQDAFGNITGANIADSNQRGTYSYSQRTGQMLYSKATTGITTLHYQDYTDYDSYGNILEQFNRAAGLSNSYDAFEYDSLHRLTRSTINSEGLPQMAIEYSYDAVGNLTKKSDYSANVNGAYQYQVGTNRLSSIRLKSDYVVSFGYDQKGNLTHRDGTEEVRYNVLNKPTYIARHGSTVNMSYDANWERFKQVRTESGVTTTTFYLGKLFEVEVTGFERTETSFISDIAILREVGSDQSIRFTHRDRLGSATTMTDQNGQVLALRSFDPFGKPRMGDGSLLESYGLRARLSNNVLDTDQSSRRGFTDHEHLDEVELIHMNGRVYDYNLGRFMSVDPFVHSGSQGLNPYSYIMNNPLAGTDPTGYTPEDDKPKRGKMMTIVDNNRYYNPPTRDSRGDITPATEANDRWDNGAQGRQEARDRKAAATAVTDFLGQMQQSSQGQTDGDYRRMTAEEFEAYKEKALAEMEIVKAFIAEMSDPNSELYQLVKTNYGFENGDDFSETAQFIVSKLETAMIRVNNSIAGDGVRLYTIISPDGPSGSQNGNNVRIHKRILESKDYNGVVITHEFLHVIGMKHEQEGTNWEGGALEVLANIAGDVNTTPHFDKRPETKAFNEQDRAILRDNLYTLHFSLMRVNFNSVDSYHHRYYQYKE